MSITYTTSFCALLQSSLLQCILGELRPTDGSVEVCGQLSYASQESWVYSNTLRENILFGQPFRRQWYESVLEACSLDKVKTLCVLCVCVRGFTSRARAARLAGPIVSLRLSCLSVCLYVCHGLGSRGTSQWRLFGVSWFVCLLGAKGSQTLPVLWTVEAQFYLHKHNIAKESQKHGNAKKPAVHLLSILLVSLDFHLQRGAEQTSQLKPAICASYPPLTFCHTSPDCDRRTNKQAHAG